MKKLDTLDPKIVEKVGVKDTSLNKFFGAIPNLLLFQIVTKFALGFIVDILEFLIQILVKNSGNAAITNMELPYLFRSWQGILILILGFIIICSYTIFDINAMVLISDNVLHKKDKSIWTIIKESVYSIKYMLHPSAILVLLFVVLVAPLTLSLTGVSLTESFYIPDFILSVVKKNPIMYIPYYSFLVVMALTGFAYLFTFQFMLLRKVNISVALRSSFLTMKKHWANFLKRYLLFLIKYAGIFLSITAVFGFIPLIAVLAFAQQTQRFWLIYVSLQLNLIFFVIRFLFIPFQIMEINRIYESYTEEDEGEFIPPEHSLHLKFWSLVAVSVVLLLGVSYASADDELFDDLFPLITPSEIIAHRAGGTLGNENTIIGLERAIKNKVYGSEIDIQRTKDGHYVVFHDDTLSRLCGVDKTPMELTLEECKQLEIPDTFNVDGKATEMATLEEFLDAAKGKIQLYIELKGASADAQMVDDLYQEIIKRDMVEDVTVISLKYDLIEKMENEHPEIKTGYLCFVSLGNVADLKCDELLLEDEMATEEVVEDAHEHGKKVYIWTVNTADMIKKRMLDETDGVITDEVALAKGMFNQLQKRADIDRVNDKFLFFSW